MREEIKKYFRSEFINRLNEIILFNSLDLEQISAIAGIQPEQLRERLKDKKIEVELTAKVRDFIAEKGNSLVVGNFIVIL